MDNQKLLFATASASLMRINRWLILCPAVSYSTTSGIAFTHPAIFIFWLRSWTVVLLFHAYFQRSAVSFHVLSLVNAVRTLRALPRGFSMKDHPFWSLSSSKKIRYHRFPSNTHQTATYPIMNYYIFSHLWRYPTWDLQLLLYASWLCLRSAVSWPACLYRHRWENVSLLSHSMFLQGRPHGAGATLPAQRLCTLINKWFFSRYGTSCEVCLLANVRSRPTVYLGPACLPWISFFGNHVPNIRKAALGKTITVFDVGFVIGSGCRFVWPQFAVFVQSALLYRYRSIVTRASPRWVKQQAMPKVHCSLMILLWQDIAHVERSGLIHDVHTRRFTRGT